MYKRIIPVVVLLVSGALFAAPGMGTFSEGNLAVSFTNGWPVAIARNGKTVLARSPRVLNYEIQEDTNWVSKVKSPKRFEPPVQIGRGQYRGRVFHGSWRVDAYVELRPADDAVRMWYEIEWIDPVPGKIRSFRAQGMRFDCGKDGGLLIPCRLPSLDVPVRDFVDWKLHNSWRNPCAAFVDDGKGNTVTWAVNTLVPYADNAQNRVWMDTMGGATAEFAFQTCGHVRKGKPQKVGDAWIVFGKGTREDALRGLHRWFRLVGQVPPVDRPDWVKDMILYSLHPGGTIGSGCKDWGGFSRATERLPDIAALGCNAVWLLPVEHRSIYWPDDYYRLQDGIGTPADYKAFTAKAHALGMKVWQDCVPHGGSDWFPRGKQHPEWLVRTEEGKSLDYWCFDFLHPEWIDYMSKVVSFYTREYSLDGFRIDAVRGSKIPSWAENIPYARASHSVSQGGFAMQRALRAAVKDVNRDAGNLAEVEENQFGAVSDAIYDFSLGSHFACFRDEDVRMLVPRLSRWLHEQQYASIPDLVRLRYLENHDQMRIALWLGGAASEACQAFISFIPGIPLVYQEQEDGHVFAYRRIFDLRRRVPELRRGEPDYLATTAPPGVWTCLLKGPGEVVPAVNFNAYPVSGTVAVRGGRSFEVSLPAFGYAVYRDGKALPVLPDPVAPTEKVWFARTAEGTFLSPFYVRHPNFAGTDKPKSVTRIYRLPQGGPCFFDSGLSPFGFTEETASVGYAEGGKVYAWHPPAGVRVTLLDSKDGKPGFHIVTEPETPVELREEPRLPEGLGTGDDRLKVVAGGWMFETGSLRVRLRRTGSIAGVWRKGVDGQWNEVVRDAYVYTDQGFVKKGDEKERTKFSSRDEIEAEKTFARDADGTLRLSFKGFLRDAHRFGQLRNRIEFAVSYVFRDDSGFDVEVRVKAHGKPVDGVPPRLLFQAWKPDGTDALRHAFLDGDETRAAFKSGKEYAFRTRLGGPQLVDGEKLTYALYVKQGIVMAKAGEASITVTKKDGDYEATLALQTTAIVEAVYHLAVRMTARLTPEMKPLRFEKHAEEGSRIYDEVSTFAYPDEGGCAVSSRRMFADGKVDVGEMKSAGQVFDLVSLIFHTRRLDVARLKPGERVKVSVVSGVTVREQSLVYRGEEEIETADGAKAKSGVFVLLAKDGGETARFVFSQEGNRVPQKLDVSLKYCSVSARLCP